LKASQNKLIAARKAFDAAIRVATVAHGQWLGAENNVWEATMVYAAALARYQGEKQSTRKGRRL
jgi:hypothetical protein